MKGSVIAIDGPNAAGKGSLARALSGQLGWAQLDSGLMYRAAAAAVMDAGAETEREIGRVVRRLKFSLEPSGRLLVNGLPGDEARLRSHEVGAATPPVARHKAVRDHLQGMQREMASRGNIVIDGRNIGTDVVPDARWKFFLTASPEVRAWRRVEEQAAQGEKLDYETVLADVHRRDKQDSERAYQPLRPAKDAVVIDTTELTLEQTVEAALKHVAVPRYD